MMTESANNSNGKEEKGVDAADDKPSIPLRWVLYMILAYALLQTIFICYQIYFTDAP